MRIAVFLCGSLLLGQQVQQRVEEAAAPPAAKAPAVPTDPDKPDPKKRARELLDKAYDSVSSARPEVQVAALMHLGKNYERYDKKKALKCFEEALAASPASGLDKSEIGNMQANVVRLMAEVDVEAAIAALPQLQPVLTHRSVRVMPTDLIVRKLIEGNKVDRAIEVLDLAGSEGEYPYRAATQIMRKLPDEDPRRATIFSSATSAYQGRPYGNFFEMVAQSWKKIPEPMLQTAVTTLVNAALDRKDEDSFSKTMSTAKGAVKFDNRADAELFELFHLFRKFDPKKAEEILEKRPNLKAQLEQFPMGAESMHESENDRNMSTSISSGFKGKPSPAQQQRMELDALAQQKAAEAQSYSGKDPAKALAIAKTIGVPGVKARVLGDLARGVSEKDPAAAKSILDDCMNTLDSIKDPQARWQTWASVAEAAHRAKQEERAWTAIQKGIEDAAELYKSDTEADAPNRAWREHWPSMQGYRSVLYRAGSLFGVDAEALLPKVTDPDLQLLATITVAQAFQGLPQEGFSVSVNKQKR